MTSFLALLLVLVHSFIKFVGKGNLYPQVGGGSLECAPFILKCSLCFLSSIQISLRIPLLQEIHGFLGRKLIQPHTNTVGSYAIAFSSTVKGWRKL